MKFFILLLFLFTLNCSINKVSKNHGFKSLEQRFEKIVVNQTNKNDMIYLIGPPSTFLTWPAWYNDIPTCYVDRFNWNRENYSFTIPSF